jgi:hypothetical protein
LLDDGSTFELGVALLDGALLAVLVGGALEPATSAGLAALLGVHAASTTTPPASSTANRFFTALTSTRVHVRRP